MIRLPAPALTLLAALVLAPHLPAQEGPGQRRPAGPPATAEGRFAWDYRSEAPALGAALRLPLLGARGDLVAGGEAVFRSGLTELQGHVDALLALGRRNAVVLGGGPAVLRSVFGEDGEKETRWGYSIVAGVRQLPSEGLGFALELRWVFVDDLEPTFLSLGVGLPFFRMPF